MCEYNIYIGLFIVDKVWTSQYFLIGLITSFQVHNLIIDSLILSTLCILEISICYFHFIFI